MSQDFRPGDPPVGHAARVPETGGTRAACPTSAPWWLRFVFVVVALILWFWTQHLLGTREFPQGKIGDLILDYTAPANAYLHEHAWAADALLIASSAIIDALGVFLLAVSIFGKTVRPFLGLLIIFALRQLCQMLCALPQPEGILWRAPEFHVPTLLVTYEVANDFFFSGHTALAVLGTVELVRFAGRRWLWLGVLIALFEATAVLLLRAHYTLDVFTGAIVALYVSLLAEKWAPACDGVLARLSFSTAAK